MKLLVPLLLLLVPLVSPGFKGFDPMLTLHLEELLQSGLGIRTESNFAQCQGSCVVLKKYFGIFPLSGTNMLLKNDLNKMTVKWLLVGSMFMDAFTAETQMELPEGTDLSKDKNI